MQCTKSVLLAGCIVLSCAGLTPTRPMPVTNLVKSSHAAATPMQRVACGRYRCGRRRSYATYYAPPVVIPRFYYGGCAPGWVDCWTPSYGGWYRPPGSEGYAGWPYY
jgi:hypothetical protein